DPGRRSATPAPTTATPVRDTSGEAARRRQDSIDAARRAADAARRRQDSIEAAGRAAANAANAANALASARNALTAVVHFEFDKSDLRDDDRATMDMKVRVLQANPSVTLR